MDTLWSNLVKSLQEGAVVAADKAGDLTRIARARLDIAATKNQIQRTQTELVARVHELLTAGSDLTTDAQVQALCNQLTEQGNELRTRICRANCKAATTRMPNWKTYNTGLL